MMRVVQIRSAQPRPPVSNVSNGIRLVHHNHSGWIYPGT